ncbi:dihydroneopterin aldolase [Desulfitobacterium dichloroeliminans LMG P-21439]|uniref:7,8-dihydroneopterin aldolase n=1 Tax=Desulfitobacterium dichloroeliminans (strain LMG P-21439 / DCA1) TaxID=871963 RepID=L0F3A4_DESDL|nr:dihydroneopterin aldolase [Desulfitobacterium dichloroeliminans]AGA67657.1 dihydroneopterin aldolase [Desulfitobacterium dichloroeliminans LMG P-21439]
MAHDRIGLRGLRFYGFHGVLNEENSLGQVFIVDIDLFTDLSKAGRSDQVEDTINYAEVYTRIKTIVEKERYQLIEKLAERIAEVILAGFVCEGISITVHKPQAPIQGIFDDAFVEIYREKKS